MQTTLNEIKKHNPCSPSWVKSLIYLNKTKADNEPIDFMTIHKAVGIKYAVWCLETQDYRDYCLFLADVAESVLPIFEAEYPDEKVFRQTIKAIRDWYNGDITKEQLKAYAAIAGAIAGACTGACACAVYAVYAAAHAGTYAAYHTAVSATNVGTYSDAVGSDWKNIDKLFTKHFGGGRTCEQL